MLEYKFTTLPQLFDMINRGEVKVFKYRREFIWLANNILDLLNSIKHNYPIGDFIFWDTKDDVDFFDGFGTYQKGNTILIDGFQRLLGLYNCFINPKLLGREFYYNFKKHLFTVFDHDTKSIVPLTSLLRTVDFLKIEKDIRSIYEDKYAEEYIYELQNLATIFRSYRIVISCMYNINETDVYNIYQKSNGGII